MKTAKSKVRALALRYAKDAVKARLKKEGITAISASDIHRFAVELIETNPGWLEVARIDLEP